MVRIEMGIGSADSDHAAQVINTAKPRTRHNTAFHAIKKLCECRIQRNKARFNPPRIDPKEGENLFIYYAGHGWEDSVLKKGFWAPAESRGLGLRPSNASQGSQELSSFFGKAKATRAVK